MGLMWATFHFPSSQDRKTVEVKVDRGETFPAITRSLKEKGVISSERLFSFWATVLAVDKKIRWGHYRFELPLSPREVLNQLVSGKGVFLRVTVPEGLTVKEIADLLEKEEVIKKQELLAEARNPELLRQLDLEGKGLEGYLFPDTYYFSPGTSAREILLAMGSQFRRKLTPAMQKQSLAMGFDIHEIVTLASVIEKETGNDAERPLISAVFHNRLKDRMPLQSDPTVIYSLDDFSGDLKRKDLRNPSPYNTYQVQGLPPGPICNPGLSSLNAALDPAPVPYLYFVSKNDGSHIFSVTLDEHNRAVKTYQIGNRGAVRR
jgi:UPF0755 protein